MLELRNILKDYVSGDNVTHALKGVSVTFRKNEFVSILGASGCGKTTLLNIIGGLDRYTSGDLLILGKSTKEYKDRDWDTYRNHSIGFVFQTYNLIAHQNILKNVELALTISGVSKEERKQRAYEALKLVGLEGMEKKKPNQLSGGQCQRVAIARALINNPEILLADEPTGALDSETSIQIMDLLKEVASDRLVVMVTHNPELAEKYSTRIIRMSDGLLISDSNPFDEKEEKVQEKPVKSEVDIKLSKGKKKQTSMSMWTSIGLSTSNLLSKMKRTVLVTIAGSIGIIGVSAVLAVSRGVKDYIGDMQNDMLSNYPLSVAEESVDYTSLMTGLNSRDVKDKFVFDPENPSIGVNSMIDYLMSAYSDFTKVKTNTIDDNLVSFIEGAPKDSAAVIKKNYGIDPTNNIFGEWKENANATPKSYSLNGLTQSYIQELTTVEGFDEYATFVNLFTSFMKELPDSSEYILDQYDVIAGDTNLSMNKEDLIFVVDGDTTLTDLILAEMGIFNHDEFLNIAKRAIKVQEIRKDENMDQAQKDEAIKKVIEETYYTESFKYDELLKRKYTYYPQNTIYKNGKVTTDNIIGKLVNKDFSAMFTVEYNIFEDNFDVKYMTQEDYSTIFKPLEFKLQRYPGDPVPSTDDPVEKTIGHWIGTVPKTSGSGEDTIELFVTDLSTPYGQVTIQGFPFDCWAKCSINGGADVLLVNTENMISGGRPVDYEVFDGYYCSAEENSSWTNGLSMNVKSILKLKESKSFGCLSSGVYYSKDFADLYMADSAADKGNVTYSMTKYIGSALEKDATFKAYVKFDYEDHRIPDPGNKDKGLVRTTCVSSLNGDLSSSFADLFSSITGSSNLNTDALHLRSLSGLKVNVAYVENSEEIDQEKTTFSKLPQSIDIYPRSFDDKDKITDYLDTWNSEGAITLKVNGENVTLQKEDRDELSYTDTIQLIVSVIDSLINGITIALVAFTSLSLLVSCFMIAVITYISVVERIKEIGVIRSLGGRKRDVAGLFIMETLMTGLFSGVFGIVITYLVELISNIALKPVLHFALFNLTPVTALIMVTISVVLSVISGLIPSQSAAHKDPVVALRSNE